MSVLNVSASVRNIVINELDVFVVDVVVAALVRNADRNSNNQIQFKLKYTI